MNGPVSKSTGSLGLGRWLSAVRNCKWAALSLKRSTAAIGAWSGSRGFMAGCAATPPVVSNATANSNAIRVFMMSFSSLVFLGVDLWQGEDDDCRQT
jgi:lipid-binding SYLF domain-containing protein